jgi:hypothetical protein
LARGVLGQLAMKLHNLCIFTFLVTCCEAVTVSNGDTVIAQIASGGTWKTTIQLVNMGNRAATFTINFYDDLGGAQMFTVANAGRVSSITGTIAIGGSRTIEIEEPGNVGLQGWGLMKTEDSIGGQVLLRQRVPGSDFEGAVPLSSQSDRHYYIPFDQTNNAITAYAMANTSPGTQRALITFRDENGVELRRATLTFAGLAHQTLSLIQFPELDGKRGFAEITVPFMNEPAAITTSVAAMALRFNANGPFTTFYPLILLSERMF